MFRKLLWKPAFLWSIFVASLLTLTFINRLQQDLRTPQSILRHQYYTYDLDSQEPPDTEQICRLPRIHPFDPSILTYLTPSKPIWCNKRFTFFTYVDPAGILKFNETAIFLAGYSISDFRCIYQEIIRRNDSDNHVIYGKTRTLPHDGVEIPYDFVSVSCYNFAGIPFYTSIHFRIAPKKPNFISHRKDQYNVLIVGIDSLSRQSFIRNLPKTYSFLTQKMKAFIFRGMTKIGDNTFPNLVALLTGKSAMSDELPRISRGETYDIWPYIWKNFSDSGYATMFAEDRPDIGLFNYFRDGFQWKPTDHYLRPYWLAVESSMVHRLSSSLCYGSVPKHKLQLNYTMEFVRQYSALSRPYFGFSFLVELTHDYMSRVASTDEDFEKWLMEMYQSGHLNRTFFFFLSDHGHRFDAMRATLVGRIEERMPFFAMVIPPSFERSHKKEISHLGVNLRRLTSPYDIYFTLLDILRLGNSDLAPADVTTSRGTSLLGPISPDRTCHMAGIPEHYCTCEEEIIIDCEDSRASRGAQVLIGHINAMLESTNVSMSKCSFLSLTSIQQSYLIIPSKKVVLNARVYFGRLVEDREARGMMSKMRIVIETAPGHALFEATLVHRQDYDLMTVIGDVSRINEYGSQSNCVKDPVLKKFCYCN